ncbi:MAG: helix-turn-helix transcriptional regulator [Alphaproteobacteria bacterium]|nr:helix-turn-helix transcriptional regulator [Alphaproteobacteria bacterium]
MGQAAEPAAGTALAGPGRAQAGDGTAHAAASETARDSALELAIGRQVRELRRRMELTVVELARVAGLSAGMLSKIENGITSPSLATLQALSRALNVPVTALFRKFEERQDALVTRAGEGVLVERRLSRPGTSFRQVRAPSAEGLFLEPFIVEIHGLDGDVPPAQHEGLELMHVLSGKLRFRHGDRVYDLAPGDTLVYGADQAHGPAAIVDAPVRLLLVTVGTTAP